MNYHDQLISVIIENKELVEWKLSVYNAKFKKEVSLSEKGDIDILVEGIDISTQKKIIIVVEVKGHRGLVQHYISKQLPKYISILPQSKQFVAYGTEDQKLSFDSITFYDPINDKIL